MSQVRTALSSRRRVQILTYGLVFTTVLNLASLAFVSNESEAPMAQVQQTAPQPLHGEAIASVSDIPE